MTEERLQDIRSGLETAYINGNLASNLEYKPSFVSNHPDELEILKQLLTNPWEKREVQCNMNKETREEIMDIRLL